MSWTKRQFVVQALDAIGIANYEFDTQSEQLQSACRQLDAMMGTWNRRGLSLAYPIPSTPEDTDLDTETNVPDKAVEAVYLNLALRIAPTFGRQVMPELKQFAYYAFSNILADAAVPNEMQFPETLPRGQGNKPYRWYRANYVNRPYGPYQPWDEK